MHYILHKLPNNSVWEPGIMSDPFLNEETE